MVRESKTYLGKNSYLGAALQANYCSIFNWDFVANLPSRFWGSVMAYLWRNNTVKYSNPTKYALSPKYLYLCESRFEYFYRCINTEKVTTAVVSCCFEEKCIVKETGPQKLFGQIIHIYVYFVVALSTKLDYFTIFIRLLCSLW